MDTQNRILLAKEEDGKWSFLGGGVDHGEDLVTALIREVKEESGLKVTAISHQPTLVTQFINTKGVPIMNIFYSCQLTSHNFTPSAECLEISYHKLDQISALNTSPEVAQFLKSYPTTAV